MDETSLRRLLDRALDHEPPMGPMVHRSVRAGLRLRRRRRARNATASLAAAAVVAGALPAVIGGLDRTSTDSRGGSHQVVIYVGSDHQDTVTPISAASNTVGQPIKSGPGPRRLAITPDGKTVYAANVSGHTVTPISTATNRAGKPIMVGKNPSAMAITPDGRTVYVANLLSGTVTPISTVANTPGKPIKAGSHPIAIDRKSVV